MGDDYERLAVFAVEHLQKIDYLLAVLGVEVAGGLVGQDYAGGIHQRAAYGDALLLTAGELVGKMLLAALSVEHLEELFKALLVDLAPVEQHGEGHVLRDVEHGDEVIELVYEAYLAAAEYGQLLVAA